MSKRVYLKNTEVATKEYVDAVDQSLLNQIQANATQYSVMPTASADNLGKIIQYTGSTTQDFTNGYFYTCIATSEEVEGETVTTYSWENINIQDMMDVGDTIYFHSTLRANVNNPEDYVALSKYITDCYKTHKSRPLFISNTGLDGYYMIFRLNTSLSNKPTTISFVVYSIQLNSNYKLSLNYTNDRTRYTGNWDGDTFTVTSGAFDNDDKYCKHVYPNGYTYSWTPSTDYSPAHKKYVDDTVANATIQVTTMPTASADNVGKIVQYTGTTDSTYTNGYFYECVSDGGDPATYSWENINTSNSSSGGVIINSLNLSDPDMLKALNVEYEQWKNNKAYCVYIEIQQGNSYKTVPVSFVAISGKTGGVMLQSAYVIYESTTVGAYLTRGIVVDASVNLNQEGQVISVSSLRVIEKNISKRQSNDDFILMAQNIAPYTPTSDYNPATKKYVDDAIGDINTILATLVIVDEEEY